MITLGTAIQLERGLKVSQTSLMIFASPSLPTAWPARRKKEDVCPRFSWDIQLVDLFVL